MLSFQLPRPTRGVYLAAAFAIFFAAILGEIFVLPPSSRASRAPATTPTAFGQKRQRPQFVPGQVLVRYRSEAAAKRQQTAMAALRLEGRTIPIRVERFDGSNLVSGLRLAHVATENTMSAIVALRKQPDILYAEPNYIMHADLTPNDPQFGSLYGMTKIGAPTAWDTTTGSSNIVVGIVDEGIDINHSDLQANIWTNPSPGSIPGISGDLHGYDFINNSGTIPAETHGTHTSGTVGAVGNNGTVSAFDASQIARTAANISNPGIAGTWKFSPVSATFPNLSTDQTDQNLTAILVGDVSGNWTPAGPSRLGPSSATVTTIPVSLPTMQDPPGGPTTIPIAVGDTTGPGVFSYDFDLAFDQAVLQPQTTPFDATGTLSSGWSINTNTSRPGHLIITAFNTGAMTGQGVLLYLKFNVIGGAGSTSPLIWQSFNFNEGDPADAEINGQFTVTAPSAANGVVSGRIVSAAGLPIEGAVVRLIGVQTRKTITNAEGNYHFNKVDNGSYTVTPARANYSFNPFNRSLSVIGNQVEAAFTGTMLGDNLNPLDTPEYFVRQQYVDILGREPDEAGFNYWTNQILVCNGDVGCTRVQRTGVAAAFFIENEFRQSGAFIYNLYKDALGRRPVYAEYSIDRRQVVGGPSLEQQKQAFAAAFVARAEFASRYESNTTAASFVDALLTNVLASGVDLSSQRDSLIGRYNAGTSQTEARTFVLRDVADSAAVRDANYNAAFVLVEYFGYLHRNPDQGGYDFWLNVLNESGRNGNPANYRGMVCSFITSTEYQRRFSAIVSHSNAECGP